MRKFTIIASIVLGIAFFSICYVFIFYVLIPEQYYDDKFCNIVKTGFSQDIEGIYINNGRSVNINLFNPNIDERAKRKKIQAIFSFITEMHKDIDRIDDINFAFLPPDARYFAPEYRYFRTSQISLKLIRSLKKQFGMEVSKRSEGWNFKRINKN